uniref:CRAL-TRIO domain-containing protein n=1 Tax=Parascaris equorum TaxID=6256 RepID=A0A914RRS6_PAREQ
MFSIQSLTMEIGEVFDNFDTDFNVYRFVLASERVNKKDKEIVDCAAKALNNHLRIRKAMQLDALPDTPFDENPIFRKHLMPCGYILPYTDNCNRLLWYLDYASINVEEEKTGRLSSIRHIIDLTDYEINPFTMIFVTNGNLSYYSQLLHFDNYPDLVTPIDMVNAPKWVHVPYKVVKTMMPTSFNDRFRLHDENFLSSLQKDITIENIPLTLGGQNEKIRTIPATKLSNEDFWKPSNLELLSTLETFHISPRKRRQIYIDVHEAGKQLSWYFITDGDIYFGIFYQV